jgi:hypothetical protein
VDAAVGQRRAHHRQLPRGDVQRALARVDVDRLSGLAVEPLVGLQQPRDALVALVGRRLGPVDLLVELEPLARQPREPILDLVPALRAVLGLELERSGEIAGQWNEFSHRATHLKCKA